MPIHNERSPSTDIYYSSDSREANLLCISAQILDYGGCSTRCLCRRPSRVAPGADISYKPRIATSSPAPCLGQQTPPLYPSPHFHCVVPGGTVCASHRLYGHIHGHTCLMKRVDCMHLHNSTVSLPLCPFAPFLSVRSTNCPFCVGQRQMDICVFFIVRQSVDHGRTRAGNLWHPGPIQDGV